MMSDVPLTAPWQPPPAALERLSFAPTEELAVEAVVAAQKAAGDPIDPNGARRLIRVLVALGLLRFP